MKLSVEVTKQWKDGVYKLSRDTMARRIAQLEEEGEEHKRKWLYVEELNKCLVSMNDDARAIMEKFVNKVDTGRARSTETYAEMKEWLDALAR